MRNMESDRVRQVRQWFGIEPAAEAAPPAQSAGHVPVPRPGEILFIVGPSGSGKSTLLAALRRRGRGQASWVNVNRVRLGGPAVIDCLPGRPLPQALGDLSRLGLGEVWTYLKRPAELSAGQRFRLRLAALGPDPSEAGTRILACDEFGGLLDPVTACVVARALRRAITAEAGRAAVLVSSRPHVLQALQPDWVATCDFGQMHLWRPGIESPGARRQS
jgi:ABC-type ATPase with predicted acetyltransferase domain